MDFRTIMFCNDVRKLFHKVCVSLTQTLHDLIAEDVQRPSVDLRVKKYLLD